MTPFLSLRSPLFILTIIFFLIFIGVILWFFNIWPFQVAPLGEEIGEERQEIVSFDTLEKGIISAVKEKKELIVETEEDWENLWAESEVDFNSHFVIAVFMGEKPTGGYMIEIEKITLDKERAEIVVSINTFEPKPGDVVAQFLTQPFHLVKVKKLDIPVQFRFEYQ